MPEGPEIKRAADKLIKAVVGQPLTHVWFAFPQLKHYQTQLEGEKIISIEPRGKALLTHFSNGLTMYSHNQLYGVWKVVKSEERPETKRDLRVVLETKEWGILLYSASDITVGPTEEIAHHPFLLKLGPDVLNTQLTERLVIERLLDKRFRRKQLSGLLLDQGFLAGLGNYLRAEILWDAELSPYHRPEELSQVQIKRLAHSLLAIPRLSYTTRENKNNWHESGTYFVFHVFHRSGEPCERCGTMIERISLSSRPFYFCPGCQK